MTDQNKDKEPQDSGDFEADWAAAMAEQQGGETGSTEATSGTQADGLGDGTAELSDDWAAALAEQTSATVETEAPASQAKPAGADPHLFQAFDKGQGTGGSDIDMIMDIPVQLSVELGRSRLTLKNILQLGQGSVVELDGLAGEPMDVFVNGYLIAQGEVVVVDEKYGIRITDIVTPSDRIHRLNSRR